MDKNTSEIAKLTERISRDPKSKLFVPLAEEYKKSGDIEMAVHVLTEGLKNNPGYVTARSFLGRLLFEMGDMNAARREFEEVIKAVPDNLLAQKKLGDLHVLSGNRTEALKCYKTARSLNPADAEIAALVADLEAGAEGVKPEVAPAPEPGVTVEPRTALEQQAVEPVKTEKPGEPAEIACPAEETGPTREEESGSTTPFSSAQTESAAAAGEVPSSAFVPEEPEVAEEVLVVEPLDDEDFAEEAQTWIRKEEQSLPGESESTRAPDSLEEVPVIPSEPEAAVARTGDTSDDFTTDTLAELYIGQGFYEKAIDIYERMLADRPDSRALQEKLDRVRSLAALAEAGVPEASGDRAEEAEAPIFSETPGLTPPAASVAEGEEITVAADLIEEQEEPLPDAGPAGDPDDRFTEPKEYRPSPPEAEETAGSGEEKLIDVVMSPPAKEFTGTEEASSAFEAREYIPLDAESRMRTEETERVGPKRAAAHRKEVIDRLEHWLKTIKKET